MIVPFSDGDGGGFRHTIEWARPSQASGAVYGTATYDNDVYDGARSFNWTDITNLVLSVSTRRGKERFGRRYRTGTAVIVADNFDGRWLIDSNGMQPGDLVRIRVVVVGSNPGDLPQPVAPGTTWNDQVANEWTSAGGLIIDDTVIGQSVTYDLFYGRVNAATDTVRGGVDVTRFELVGQAAALAVIDKDAGPSVGAGELSDARMQRILDNAGQGLEVLTVLGTALATMAATNLSKNALTECQLTAETEGGDFFLDVDGTSVFGTRNWLTQELRSITVQAFFGGMTGVGVVDSQPTRELQLVVNDATYSNAGGTSQNAQDAASIARYSHRTFRRLDLLGDSDSDMLFLASRAVAQLKDVRPRARRVTMKVTDTAAGTLGGVLRFGDLAQSTIESINSWGNTFQAHIIGIEHAIEGVEWTVTYVLDDAFIADTDDGGFDNQAFSTGFNLGGP